MELIIGGGVVFAILLIAVPLMMRQRVARNHAAAFRDMEMVHLHQLAFFANSGNVRYASLDELYDRQEVGNALTPKERRTLQNGTRHGYLYQANTVRRDDGSNGYDFTAVPVAYARTGVLSFYMNETGIIRAGNIDGQRGDSSLPPYPQEPAASADEQ